MSEDSLVLITSRQLDPCCYEKCVNIKLKGVVNPLPNFSSALLWLQVDGVRDIIEEGALQLSSQEAETIQDWLFLSSSQLDHLESPEEEECMLTEQKVKEDPSVESGECNVLCQDSQIQWRIKLLGNSLQLTSSRKRSHPEP